MFRARNDIRLTSSDDTVIWRYMDLGKLVSLLHRRTLFFSAASRMEDYWEGALSAAAVARRRRREKGTPVEQDEAEFRRLFRHFVLLNCWHKSSHESDAMWRLYTRGDEGVAVRSTVGQLKRCFTEEEPEVYLADIQYISYREHRGPGEESLDQHLRPFTTKREAFAHEQELRALVDLNEGRLLEEDEQGRYTHPLLKSFNRRRGIDVPVDLECLVGAIVLSPYCANYFHEAVSAVVEKMEPKLKVEASSLKIAPYFGEEPKDSEVSQ